MNNRTFRGICAFFRVTSGSSNYLDGDVGDEYSLAEYYGRHHGSCSSIYPNCPISVTNLFSRAVPTF